jgi:hypothetical protein
LHPPAQISGYARVCTNEQDLATPRKALTGLGDRRGLINGDRGVTGRNKQRPGLNEALAAVRAAGALVVTKLDGFYWPLPDAREHHRGHEDVYPTGSGWRQG